MVVAGAVPERVRLEEGVEVEGIDCLKTVDSRIGPWIERGETVVAAVAEGAAALVGGEVAVVAAASRCSSTRPAPATGISILMIEHVAVGFGSC